MQLKIRARCNIVLNVLRTFSSGIEQQPVSVHEPLVRMRLRFFSREVSLRPSLYIRFVFAFHPDGGVRRTSYACTPNVVRTYTERRTSPLLPDGKAGMMLRKPQTRRFLVSLKLYGEKSEGTRMKKTPIRLPLPRHKREALDGFKLVELIIVKNGAEEFCVVVITRSDAEKLCYFGI